MAILVAACWAFGTLAEDVANGDPIVRLDQNVAGWLHERGTPALTSVMRATTALGSAWVLIGVSVAAVLSLVLLGRRRDALLVTVAITGAEVITFGLKLGFDRKRPFFADPLATESSPSFPSGHSSVSLAFYGALAYVIASQLDSAVWRRAVLIGAGVLVVAIGFSRLYLGVHFLSDVLAGYSAGMAWLVLCVLAFGSGRRRAANAGESITPR